ncbi:hypothetical protein EYF80_045558 [Liparis tanakae]|uniref:Uncharacterized protein n=1 Tax=Liparis tanakae TaxID=230148 RepID=A0A4Z2FTN7_9TELE|nr:hypothetical protein EYF80_045558 [Liparis tanakae]
MVEEVCTWWRRCGHGGGGVDMVEEVWMWWRRCGHGGGGVDMVEEMVRSGPLGDFRRPYKGSPPTRSVLGLSGRLPCSTVLLLGCCCLPLWRGTVASSTLSSCRLWMSRTVPRLWAKSPNTEPRSSSPTVTSRDITGSRTCPLASLRAYALGGMQRDTHADTMAAEVPGSMWTLWTSVATPCKG